MPLPRSLRPGIRRFCLLAVLLLFGGCGGGGPEPSGRDPGGDDEAVEGAMGSPTQVARSPEGMVSAAQPHAAEAGARMLEAGGNAVDAAVATAFALSVVEPSMSGLGGRAQILIRLPDGRHVGIDGTTQAPATYDPDTAERASYGYPTVGVPGVPAALLEALDRYGSLDPATVMAPAIALARDGFELLPGEARRHAAELDRIREFEGSRGVFIAESGRTHEAGALFVQPDLARTLQQIAEGGADAFYRGPIAEAIVADMEARGGAVTADALAAYRAEVSELVSGSYRGHDLIGLWLPSYGAITIQILHLLETLPMDEFDEDDWALALAEAIRVGYLDRPNQSSAGDAARLTSKEWAAERASMMRLPEVAAVMGSAPRGRDGDPDGGPESLPMTAIVEGGHTTHLTTADASGMVVALTQSLGPNMGSRVVTPGLGFLYAATLGGYLGRMEPGERARSHISPFMVEREGEPWLALGAAGGGRIPTAIVAVISRLVDRGMTLEDALRAPRIVPDTPGGRVPGDPDAETAVAVEIGTGIGFQPEAIEALRSLGIDVDEVEREGAFGRVHAVRWHADTGVWEGAADPDWEGVAVAPGGRP